MDFPTLGMQCGSEIVMTELHVSCMGAGQSQPPQHLSMFLEVSDGQSSGNWSCFVSHRLAIVNQRDTSRSLVKESQVIWLTCSVLEIASPLTLPRSLAVRSL